MIKKQRRGIRILPPLLKMVRKMQNDYLLQMKAISKQFPGVKALDAVDFNVKRGEIHALMGENGAGKSTLIKILTGIHKKDTGEIIFDDEVLRHMTTIEAQHKGISTIYQELNLIPYLNIWENLFLGREIKKFGLIDKKEMQEKAKNILKDMGLSINIDVNESLNMQSVAIQQMVAIARAISIDVKLLVMDEPTSSLTDKEVKVLFNVIRKLKIDGISVIFISHRISEIFEICDRVTVLKDGCRVDELSIKGLSSLKLVSLMIGRDATQIMNQKREKYRKIDDDSILKATDIKKGKKVNGINLHVNKGEVVGISGLLGSGRTEFAKIIYGDDMLDEGEIEIDGKKVRFHSPREAVKKGLSFCSEDRKEEGIFPHLSVEDNITMALLKKLSKYGIVSKKAKRKIALEYIEKLGIKTPGPDQIIRNLSGGNQQKTLLARWLCMNPRLMILDEPTRGIDVAAKSEIEALVQEVASRDISVMMISSELHELIRGCDRVAVIKEGEKVKELVRDEITEENLMDAIAHGDEQ